MFGRGKVFGGVRIPGYEQFDNKMPGYLLQERFVKTAF